MTLTLHSVAGGYPDTPVVHDVSLRAVGGEIVAILGPSGSGKTTLLRMIAGLHPLSSGSVLLDGEDVTALPAHRRRVGLVPQEGALFPRLTVAANIGYGIPGLRARHAHSHPRVREMLQMVELDGFARRLPHELSGGQRQRVAIARALAPEPAVILLDEPFNALDAQLRRQVRDNVERLLRKAGVAAILITHDRREAFSLADRVAVFDHGRILQDAAPDALYRRPASLHVARATGEVLLLRADPVPGAALVRTAVGELAAPKDATGITGVGLRPEQLRLVPAGSPGTVSLRVRGHRRAGDRTLVDLELGNGAAITVRAGAFDDLPDPGSLAGIRVQGEPVTAVRDATLAPATPLAPLEDDAPG